MGALNGGLTLFDHAGVSATPGAGTAVASITAPDGKPVDLAAGGSQGVELLPPMTSSATPTPYAPFTGPTGTYELTMASKGALSELIQFPGFDFSSARALGLTPAPRSVRPPGSSLSAKPRQASSGSS